MSAHETTPGHCFSSASLISSITSYPLKLKFAGESFSAVLSLESIRTEPSHPYSRQKQTLLEYNSYSWIMLRAKLMYSFERQAWHLQLRNCIWSKVHFNVCFHEYLSFLYYYSNHFFYHFVASIYMKISEEWGSGFCIQEKGERKWTSMKQSWKCILRSPAARVGSFCRALLTVFLTISSAKGQLKK